MKLRVCSLLLALVTVLALASCAGTGGTSLPTTQGTTGTPTTPTTPTRSLSVDLDLSAEWNKVTTVGSLVQGCVVVRKEFLEAHPDAIADFLADYEASIHYLSTNLDDAAGMIVAQGIFASAPVAKKAIPKCNVLYLDGAEMKSAMNNYLTVLHGINPAAVGNAIPSEDFYYDASAQTANGEDLSTVTAKVFTLNGTTGFGMAKLMNDAAAGNTDVKYEFTVKADASEVTAALINGDADIAALPTNAAANVYNKTQGKVKILAVNTLGCLYLTNNTGVAVTSIADLKGKTVYVPAQNPTFIFTYLCQQNGLVVGKDITIDSTSYAQPALLRDAVAAGVVDYAVLPEPMVTIAQNAASAGQK